MTCRFIVQKFRRICDPTKVVVWGGQGCDTGPISIQEVRKAVREKCLAEKLEHDIDWQPRKYHVERIAFLVVNGWKDPIEVDVGIPSLGHGGWWPVQDGNHRWFAAIVRRDPTILTCASGAVREIKRLCGVKVP